MNDHIRTIARRLLGPGSIEESEWAYRLLRNHGFGVLVEVGAHHGDATLQRFAKDGWEVHAFEPDPENRAELIATIAALPTVTVVPKAVSNKPGTLPLYRSAESSGISSLTPFTDSHVTVESVDVITLTDYLESGPEQVTLLKIDVEGFEKFVLDGFPWDSHHPDVVLLEFEDRKTIPLGYTWRELADVLVLHGYEVLVSEWFPIERYGAAHRWRGLSAYPTALADENAWGNLLATRHDSARLLRIARMASIRLKLRNACVRAARYLSPG